MTETNYPLYVLIHEHQYGPTSHPFFWTGAKAPEAISIAQMLAIDFESEKEEFISIDGPLRIAEAPILHEPEAEPFSPGALEVPRCYQKRNKRQS